MIYLLNGPSCEHRALSAVVGQLRFQNETWMLSKISTAVPVRLIRELVDVEV